MPLLLLLAYPLIEIALFIEIGGAIGLWPTLAIIVLTAVIGGYIMRRQGLASLREAQTRLAAGENPNRALADTAMIMIAGVLLLLPGFLSGAIGAVLLLPPVRTMLFGWMGRRAAFVTMQARRAGRVWPGGETVDGEFTRVDPDADDAPRRRDDDVEILPPRLDRGRGRHD